MTVKTLDDHFHDWIVDAIPGGGDGEAAIIPVLHRFMRLCADGQDDLSDERYGMRGGFNHQVMEKEFGPALAWMLILMLEEKGMFICNSSPRYGEITERGLALKDYFETRAPDDLIRIANLCDGEDDEDYRDECYPDHCNCGTGEKVGDPCPNPFWRHDCTRLARRFDLTLEQEWQQLNRFEQELERKLALVRRNRINELIKKGMTEKQAHDYIAELDKWFVEAVRAPALFETLKS